MFTRPDDTDYDDLPMGIYRPLIHKPDEMTVQLFSQQWRKGNKICPRSDKSSCEQHQVEKMWLSVKGYVEIREDTSTSYLRRERKWEKSHRNARCGGHGRKQEGSRKCPEIFSFFQVADN
jgi:hypothetical protein